MSAEADLKIRNATISLLGGRSYDDLSIEAIARCAGVSKTTIYRRWPTKEAVVVAAVEQFVHDITIPDTGLLRSDLRGLLGDTQRAYLSKRGRLLPALAAAMEHHPALSRAVRGGFLEPRRRAVLKVLERARDRGEIGARADLDFIHDLLVGPFVYRRLFTGGPIDDKLVEQLVDVALSLCNVTAADSERL